MIDKTDLRYYLADKNLWDGKEEHIIVIKGKYPDIIIELYLYPTSSHSVTKTISLIDYNIWLRRKKLEKILK